MKTSKTLCSGFAFLLLVYMSANCSKTRIAADATCSIVDDGHGNITITCPDGSEARIPKGQAGDDGASCHAVTDTDGTKSIVCSDGTSFSLQDGSACGATVLENGDIQILCDDGSSFSIAAPADGRDGSSCSAVSLPNGEYQIVCSDGSSFTVRDGDAGTDQLVKVDQLAAQSECPHGGVAVQVGHDKNHNQQLDPDEIESQDFICQGVPLDGSSGMLVRLAAAPSGSNCVGGGTRVNIGFDLNANGQLDDEEIYQHSFICSGLPYDGTSGIVWGDYYINNTLDNAMLSGIWGVGGTIFVNCEPALNQYYCNLGTPAVYLPELVAINGAFEICPSCVTSRPMSYIQELEMPSLEFINAGLIINMTDLINLDGLSKLYFVGHHVIVESNPLLSDLHGLDGLTEIGGALTIVDNPKLPTCEAERLRDRIGIANIHGGWSISGNDDAATCP